MKLLNSTRITLVFSITIFFTSCGRLNTEIKARRSNEQGLEFLSQGQFDSAIATFKAGTSLNGVSKKMKAILYRNIAQVYNEMDAFDSSIAYSKLSANCYKPESYDYLVNMADVDLLTDNTDAAVSKLQKAIKIKNDEVAANNSLGLIYLGEYGDDYYNPSKALQFNKKAYEINKDRSTLDVLARNYFLLDDFATAEKYYEILTKAFPQFTDYKVILGIVDLKLNKNDEAEALFQEALQKDSSYIDQINYYKEEVNSEN
ncbi:MAG TPA: tetratricopeptide repeat protein [Ginsengibacter sp.]|nr:tetratricopeptide repeat protein [Chitinophagaceae bacterium]MCZ2396229.1 tetratricopeptide repeat protein [Chitinophagales bacterium]HRN71487.1 tetratricopeptide repeat protein [Ginsengibacter sp.]HRP16711.1 tetratricopeptide repeat protein [Ginsengibacter sp.]HRP44474.1 tetratricopeptide repeat protein [Ginsengibacter sp.]